MTKQIPVRDWERLSAYLDDDLSPRQRQQFEERLKSDAPLAQALARLQGTRHLLGRAPQAQAPRSFILTPEMAGARETWLDRLPVSLNLVSAVATAMLVFVFLGDFLTPGGIVSYSDLSAASAPLAEMAADAEGETMALEVPEEERLEADSLEADSLEATSEEDLAEEESEEAAAEALPEDTSPYGTSPKDDGEEAQDEALDLPPNAGGGLDDGAQSDEDAGERLIEEQVPQESGPVRRLHIFLVEAVLALIALVSGLGAWLQRRMS